MLPTHALTRILILDDDEVMREVLEATLAADGFEVTSALHGEDALRLLEAGVSFDLILSDVQMPGLGGPELAYKLRAAAPPEVVLLGMSGSPPADEVKMAFDGFLLKPFSIQLLRDESTGAQARKAAVSSPAASSSEASLEAVQDVSPILDGQIFNSLQRMIPGNQLSELYAMALKDIGKRHTRMVDAAGSGDLLAVRAEAHAVKGSCGMIGATELQKLAAELEGGTTISTSALDAIPPACERLRRMLDTKFHPA